jgi:hypothetical protein
MNIKSVINKITNSVKDDLEEDQMFMTHKNLPDGFTLESEYENMKVILGDYLLKPLVKRNDDFHSSRFVKKGHKPVLEIKYLTLDGDVVVHLNTCSVNRQEDSFNDIEFSLIKSGKIVGTYVFSGKSNIINNQTGIINAINDICKSHENLLRYDKYKTMSESNK